MPAAKPQAALDPMALLVQAMTGVFQGSPSDGLRALAVNGRSQASPYGPNPGNLWGPELVRYWSSLDEHTPDKLNQGRLDEMFRQYPGSPFAKWYQGIGASPGQGGNFSRGASYQAAFGGGGGGGVGGGLSNWLNPAKGLGKIFG